MATPEEYAEYSDTVDERETADHLYKEGEYIETDYQFKSKILDSDSLDLLDKVDRKETKIANLDNRQFKAVLNDLDLATDLAELGLVKSSATFARRAVLTCNISRSKHGFQQDKFNESRNVRVADIAGLKKRPRFMRRGR
jgi:hypothetical protein